MGLGAVVAIGAKNQRFLQDHAHSIDLASAGREGLLVEPLEWVDVAGRSLVERMIERFTAIEVELVSVLVEEGTFLPAPLFRASQENLTVEVVSDLYSAVARKLSDYSDRGIERSFLHRADTYAETDLLDLFCFHREARQAATCTFDKEGPVALWVVDCAKAQSLQLESLIENAEYKNGSKYFIREYVSRLAHPRDLRQFAADVLRGSCQTGPSGRQVRTGIWIDDGAEIHRRARIVAPAYIGRGSRVRADALITRFSNVERDCLVDCGTVIEDSSILPNTSVGIWLDLCHAVANANKLMNLERDVVIEISDPKVMRSTVAVSRPVPGIGERREKLEKVAAPSPKESRQMPETWRFSSNLIQE